LESTLFLEENSILAKYAVSPLQSAGVLSKKALSIEQNEDWFQICIHVVLEACFIERVLVS
jgi:hypothetical protein